MSRAAYPLKLPNSIKNAAQRLAREDGVSLNQWISSAVAQKVGSVETAAAFFKQRAETADGAAMMRVLVNAPDLTEHPEKNSTSREGRELLLVSDLQHHVKVRCSAHLSEETTSKVGAPGEISP